MSAPPSDPAQTRNMANVNADIKARVDATEQAKKENLIWFSNYRDNDHGRKGNGLPTWGNRTHN